MATDAERNRGLGAYSTPGVDVKPDLSPAPIITSSPDVTFQLKSVTPPSQVYISNDDFLSFAVRTSIANTNIIIRTRLLRKDGKIQPSEHIFFPVTDRSSNVFFVTLAEGYLLGVEVSSSAGATNVNRGQTYVQGLVSRGNFVTTKSFQPLFAGYLLNSNFLGWPGSSLVSAVEGPGFPRTVSGTTPGAGAEVTETVPTGARWRIISFDYALVTAAAVANRETVLLTDDGVTTNSRVPSGFTQAAGLTHEYDYAPGVTRFDGTQALVTIVPMPPIILSAGGRIRTSTVNLQAADQYSNVRYEIEEWIES